jgi:hypothetical protein
MEIECLFGAAGKSEREVRRVPLVVRPVKERGRIPARFWWWARSGDDGLCEPCDGAESRQRPAELKILFRDLLIAGVIPKAMKLGDEFTSLLHREYLKPLGFKKVRRTFSREHERHIERYQLQGSAWNTDGMRWTFYLNCGITFIGLPRRQPDPDFPHAHAYMRAGYFTDKALAQYDVSRDHMVLIAEGVRDAINEVSGFFARRCEHLRASYLKRKYFHLFLDDAELNERIAPHLAAIPRETHPSDGAGASTTS